MTSPESTGGRGYTYEDAVAAAYLGGLLSEEFPPMPGLARVAKVSVQQRAHGAPMDDVVVEGTAQAGEEASLNIQAKQSLTISDAKSNTDWRACLSQAWRTFANATFREGRDGLAVATETISDATRKDFQQVTEWARASLDAPHFMARFSGAAKRGALVEQTRGLLSEAADRSVTDTELHRFLAHFWLLKLDVLDETGGARAAAISALARALAPNQSIAPASVWNEIRTIARDASGEAGQYDRSRLIRKLAGTARFDVAPSLRADIAVLKEEARLAASQIPSDVDGVEIARARYVDGVWPDETPSLLLIAGQAGAGKSAVLKKAVQRALQSGPTLFVKADRLDAASLREYFEKLGVNSLDANQVLAEIGMAGNPILFIDGLDRIGAKQRPVILDLLDAIATLRRRGILWRVVATLRDYGLEPLRAWIPAVAYEGGSATISVSAFDDDEAQELAEARPHLRTLLFGAPTVREIARRPFFVSVLARGLENVSPAPQTEVDLIRHWWRLGGFNADPKNALVRQRAIIELGRAGLENVGAAIRIARFSVSIVDTFAELREDGVIRDDALGKTVRFAHDIFFEWALFNALEESGPHWIDELRKAGEPPFMGRVVELLAQAAYPDGGWADTLPKLKASVRPQWLRAWLLGPIAAPDFSARDDVFTQVSLGENGALARKALVWFQAEKTTPNAKILTGDHGILPRLEPRRRLALADALSWPSDILLWSRFVSWIARYRADLPLALAPDVTAVFGVWQNMMSETRNEVSRRIITQSISWLEDLEDRFEFSGLERDAGPWKGMASEERDALTTALRVLVLRCAHVYPDEVRAYLVRLSQHGRLKEGMFEELMRFSFTLARRHASELAAIVRAHVLEELPEAELERELRELQEHKEAIAQIEAKPPEERSWSETMALESPSLFHHIGSNHDWRNLCLGEGYRVYQPESPLREPFHSLFKYAPDEALSLVRDVINHATEAWRQLHRVGDHSKGTPEPIVVHFPWGDQTFWGDEEHYLWERGTRGPQAVACALMALEAWALEQLRAGITPDELIKAVLKDQNSFSLLAVAMMIARETQLVSEVSLALVITQHIWSPDIHRYMEDQRGPPRLFMFQEGEASIEHIEALRCLYDTNGRRGEVRHLVMFIALQGSDDLKARLRAGLDAFPNTLPFFFAEEREHDGHVGALRRSAQIWAPLGHEEIYRLEPVGDGRSFTIETNNPAVDPVELAEVHERSRRNSQEMRLFFWAENTFEHGTVSEDLTLEAAVELAKTFDRDSLFDPVEDFRNATFLPAAVIGTAAAVIRFGDSESEQWSWARSILPRVLAAPVSGSRMDDTKYHPLVFAIQALRALVERDIDRDESGKALLTLMIAPLREVALGAYRALCGLCAHTSALADAAAVLGLELAVIDHRGYRNDDQRKKQWRQRSKAALKRSLARWKASKGWSEIADLPAPYVFAAPSPTGDEFYDRRLSTAPTWRRPDLAFEPGGAKDYVSRWPVASIMASDQAEAFLSLCDALIAWTLEYSNPSWRDPKERRSGQRDVELKTWLRLLGSLFAHVSLFVPADVARQRFVTPFAALDEDDLAQPYLYSYSSSLICRTILDGNGDLASGLAILSTCLDRILQYYAFKRGSYREGRIYDNDVQLSLRAFMFVEVKRADQARRFVNGDWSDLALVRPLFANVIAKTGWTTDGADAFVKLGERAGDAYRLDWFAEDVLTILDPNGFPTPEWRRTDLPLDIANLIQEQAQRTQPLPTQEAQKLLRALDILIDYGDRRSAALQSSELFRHVQAPGASG